MVAKNIAFLSLVASVLGQIDAIPAGFSSDQWAWVSNEDPLLAVIPGRFNRTVFQAPSAGDVSDERVAAINEHINQTSFVAYDQRFFDLIGPNATVEQLQMLPFQVHEAPCHIPEKSQLFFVEWGPPGGENGTHDYQYVLDLKTNNLTTVRTNPPTYNVHGCVYQKGKLHVVTDGGPNETPFLATVDPNTWERKTILNNYYGRPFISFNDLELDSQGNYYLTDSFSGWGRDLHPYSAPTRPTVYFVNGTTLRPKELAFLQSGNTNGISLSPDGKTLYLADTGASEVKPSRRNFQGPRDLWAWDFATSSTGERLPLLVNQRLLSRAMQYFYDGLRVSRSGWIFGAGGEVVDILDPESGWTLGSIRVGGGGNDPDRKPSIFCLDSPNDKLKIAQTTAIVACIVDSAMAGTFEIKRDLEILVCKDVDYRGSCTKVDCPRDSCRALPEGYDDQISSIRPDSTCGNCRFYEHHDCEGRSFELKSGEVLGDLYQDPRDFNDQTRLKALSEDQLEEARHGDSRKKLWHTEDPILLKQIHRYIQKVVDEPRLFDLEVGSWPLIYCNDLGLKRIGEGVLRDTSRGIAFQFEPGTIQSPTSHPFSARGRLRAAHGKIFTGSYSAAIVLIGAGPGRVDDSSDSSGNVATLDEIAHPLVDDVLDRADSQPTRRMTGLYSGMALDAIVGHVLTSFVLLHEFLHHTQPTQITTGLDEVYSFDRCKGTDDSNCKNIRKSLGIWLMAWISISDLEIRQSNDVGNRTVWHSGDGAVKKKLQRLSAVSGPQPGASSNPVAFTAGAQHTDLKLDLPVNDSQSNTLDFNLNLWDETTAGDLLDSHTIAASPILQTPVVGQDMLSTPGLHPDPSNNDFATLQNTSSTGFSTGFDDVDDQRSPWLDKQLRMAPMPLNHRGWLNVLHIAAQEGHEHLVRMLLQHGIDPNEQDSDGLTPLMHATIEDHHNIVHLLLTHGARLGVADRESRTALHWAVLHQRESILRALMERNATVSTGNISQDLTATTYLDVDAYDAAGWTPLHMAVCRGFEAGVGILIRHGANVTSVAQKCPYSGSAMLRNLGHA
ncbi:AkeP protein [Paramyrothecium foliicola]|nr:AkeP protein [Paramyrothecium foliicola]